MKINKKTARKTKKEEYPYRVYNDYYYGKCKIVRRVSENFVAVENKHGYIKVVADIFLQKNGGD
jgi:hypothetical protein